jgi:hypothetical protein
MNTTRFRDHRVAASLAAVLLVLSSSGCAPPVREDDAGDASWVRQVVPVLYGRKVRGYDELKALTDLVSATDRETVARALLEDEEFATHWTEVLVDQLRVHRDPPKAQTVCYADPLLGGAPTDDLAEHILTTPPSNSFPSDFNMSDVVRSSLVLDNLYPIYRAHLFPMETKSEGFPEQARRDDLGATFGRVYLNRELSCLLCHNSDNSLSGEASGWDRTHAIPGSFETALYGASTGTTPEAAYAIFRTDVNGGTLEPWGISGCGTFKPTIANDPQNVFAYFTSPLGKKVTVKNLAEILHFGYTNLATDGLNRSLPQTEQEQCDFCATSCAGVDVSPDAPNDAVNAAAVKTLLVSTCGVAGCHVPASDAGGLSISNDAQWFVDLVNVPASPPGEIRVAPGDALSSYVIKKLRGSPGISGSQMPLGGDPLEETEIEMIENWIDDIPSDTACNVCDELDCNQAFPKEVQGFESFAFLVALRIVENVWDEVMGHPLTIANYFPRNASQQQLLWNLTEYHFIPNDWSLKELLVRILTSDYFNRNAPRFSTGTTAYEVPNVYDPWVEADPREPPVTDPGYDPNAHPENHKNSMGEGVYRYSARSLLNSIHRALDWTEPERFPGASYPDATLARAMGQFFSDNTPGTRSVDFQGLLYWESIHGICEKPSGVASDWIDSLMTGIAAFPPGDPGGPLTVEDLVVVTRDWLLGDGTIATDAPEGLTEDERAQLADLFGVDLDDPASSVVDLEGKLRSYCGVLVETPQSLLAGITPSGVGPEPRLRACTDGPCTYQEICEALEPEIEALLPPESDGISCAARSLTARFELERIPELELCPPGICSQLPEPRVQECLVNPRKCLPLPPACDPRAARFQLCGEPESRRPGGLLLAWADGASVSIAEGVQIKRAGSPRFSPMEQGTTLREGDIVAVPRSSRLAIRTEGGEIRTPRGGIGRDDAIGTRLLLVTGPGALAQVRPSDPPPAAPRTHIDYVYQKGWLQWGEGGKPLSPEERRTYVYPELSNRPQQQRQRR